MRRANTCQTLRLDSNTDIYVYAIVHSVDNNYLALRSDDKISAFQLSPAGATPLWTFSPSHSGTNQVLAKQIQGQNSTLLSTAGTDGSIKLWDPRIISNEASNFPPVQTLAHKSNPSSTAQGILSLASHGSSAIVAAGTELAGPGSDATIQFWDLRSPESITHKYIESHSDDIVKLEYHPSVSTPEILLSGSTDGLVNIYNTNITDEDDAVLQVFNHGAGINHAGFLTEDVVYALSSDEQFSLYELADPANENMHDPENEEEGPSACAFGDIRQTLDCDYVVDIVHTTDGPVISAGSFSQNKLDLVPLKRTPAWEFRREESIRLDHGLGNELVRCVHVDDVNGRIIAGSEDNIIRIWSQFS